MLLPVPLDHHIAAVLVNPAMGYPLGMPLRRHFPSSRGPHVFLAIPIVVSLNPHMLAARWSTPLLDHDLRWCKLNHNFRRHSAEGQRADKNPSDQSLQNHNRCPFQYSNCEPTRFSGAGEWPFGITPGSIRWQPPHWSERQFLPSKRQELHQRAGTAAFRLVSAHIQL